MKLFIATTLALFASAFATSDQEFGVVARAKDASKHKAGDCAGYDTLISSKMNEAIIKVNGDIFGRRLNERRANDWCDYWCEGFGYGTCHWAWPWCYPMRRNLGGDEPKQGNKYFEEFNSIECAKAVVSIEAEFAELTDSIENESCKEYLKDAHTFKCLRIKSDP